MNFSEFSKAKKQAQKLSPEAKTMLSDFLSAYNGKSESELMQEILKTAEENRAKGTLSDADIDNFEQMLSPMLTSGQREKLSAVAKKLKSQG